MAVLRGNHPHRVDPPQPFSHCAPLASSFLVCFAPPAPCLLAGRCCSLDLLLLTDQAFPLVLMLLIFFALLSCRPTVGSRIPLKLHHCKNACKKRKAASGAARQAGKHLCSNLLQLHTHTRHLERMRL